MTNYNKNTNYVYDCVKCGIEVNDKNIISIAVAENCKFSCRYCLFNGGRPPMPTRPPPQRKKPPAPAPAPAPAPPKVKVSERPLHERIKKKLRTLLSYIELKTCCVLNVKKWEIMIPENCFYEEVMKIKSKNKRILRLKECLDYYDNPFEIPPNQYRNTPQLVHKLYGVEDIRKVLLETLLE